ADWQMLRAWEFIANVKPAGAAPTRVEQQLNCMKNGDKGTVLGYLAAPLSASGWTDARWVQMAPSADRLGEAMGADGLELRAQKDLPGAPVRLANWAYPGRQVTGRSWSEYWLVVTRRVHDAGGE